MRWARSQQGVRQVVHVSAVQGDHVYSRREIRVPRRETGERLSRPPRRREAVRLRVREIRGRERRGRRVDRLRRDAVVPRPRAVVGSSVRQLRGVRAHQVRTRGRHVGDRVSHVRAHGRRADIPRGLGHRSADSHTAVFRQAHPRADDGVQRQPEQRRGELRRAPAARPGGRLGGEIRGGDGRRRARVHHRVAVRESSGAVHGGDVL
mmetsp:Transcript_9572/g.34875  ORF Transcript_9572/g.34875 Transcript_9572/m.34875 type:complete len:207 (+) Transcript_9572:897-1517(+)